MVYIYSASRLNYLVVARAFVDLPLIEFTLVPKSSLVSIPSISAVPPPFVRVRTASEWLYEKLKRLPALLRGRARVVFDALGLGETQIDRYENLKAVFLKGWILSRTSRRRLREDQESDIERLLGPYLDLHSGSPRSELRLHLIKMHPE